MQIRVLARTPAFTLTAVATLALVIGATTAVFSLADALLWRPLPFPDADRLGMITSAQTQNGITTARPATDGAMWEAVRDRVPSLDAAVIGSGGGVNLVLNGSAGLRTPLTSIRRLQPRPRRFTGTRPLVFCRRRPARRFGRRRAQSSSLAAVLRRRRGHRRAIRPAAGRAARDRRRHAGRIQRHRRRRDRSLDPAQAGDRPAKVEETTIRRSRA